MSYWQDLCAVTALRLKALRCHLLHRRHHVLAPSWLFEGCRCDKCGHRFTGSTP